MSTTPRRTARLVVTGLTGAALALAPVASAADRPPTTTAAPAESTTADATPTDQRSGATYEFTSPSLNSTVKVGTVTFVGRAPRGEVVNLWLGRWDGPTYISIGSTRTTADRNGLWTIRMDAATAGPHVASLRDKNLQPRDRVTFTVANPLPLTITSPRLSAHVSRGDVTFAGTGTPGQTVAGYLTGPFGSPDTDTGQMDTPEVRADGTWSFTYTITQPGLYRVVIFSPGAEDAVSWFTVS